MSIHVPLSSRKQIILSLTRIILMSLHLMIRNSLCLDSHGSTDQAVGE